MKRHKKTSATPKTVRAQPPQPEVFFNETLDAYVQALKQTVLGVKSRPNESQNYGGDGMYILISESLSLAREQMRTGNVQAAQLSYLSAGAYCVAASMLTGGSWFLGLRPQPPAKEVPPGKETKNNGDPEEQQKDAQSEKA